MKAWKLWADATIIVLVVMIACAGLWKLFEVGVFLVEHVSVVWVP